MAARTATTTAMQDELLITKREMLAIFFRRKWEMVGIFVASIAIAAFFAYYMLSPNYDTEAKIIINSSYLTEPLRDAPPESEFEKLAGFHTQRDLIESERMAREAVKRTNLAERRVIGRVEKLQIFVGDIQRFFGRLLGIESWAKPWSAEGAAIAEVDEWVRTSALPDSKAIKVTYRAKDPHEAVDVLNAVLAAHREYYYETYRQRAAGVGKFLQQEFELALTEIREAENALLQFRLKDRMETAKLNLPGRSNPAQPSFVGITDSTKVQDELKLYVLKLEEELRQAGDITDNQRRDRLRADISSRMKLYLDALNALPERELEMVRLRRKYDAANDTFQILQRNLARAKIVAEGDSQQVRLIEVFEKPMLKETPVSPKKRLIMIMAALLGAVLAITWAVVANYLDHTLRTPWDVERHLGLRLVGSLRRI
jgi:uncharacterized protein involved in exopolysaccharide biosynthesis